MINHKFFILFTIIATNCFVEIVKCEPELKLLHVLFRHGDKVPHTPWQSYPTDPHKNHSYFPTSNGGLTNVGKLREYKIGTMLRNRYDEFLGPYYSTDLIDARTTYVGRTHMSVQLVLAAMFPPVGEQIWNPRLSWQPIFSTYVNDVDQDYLFFPDHCHLYREEYAKFLAEDSTKKMIAKYQATLDYLTKHTGKVVDNTEAVYYLFNTLKEEAAQNLTLPEWTSSVYPHPMEEILALDFDLRSWTTNLKRLNGGNMLRKITEDIKAVLTGNPALGKKKAFLFSGHEQNVARLSRVLGTGEPMIPAYGSTIIIETIQDREKGGNYFVRILLWTGVTERLITQSIPGCNELCPLDEFLNLLKDVIPSDEEYLCGSEKKNSGSKLFGIKNTWVTVFVASIIVSFSSTW
ncbi:venom acid phosphatase Acph-1-like [Athalia rosae]|uniref:venom acid phosphatase Acph-1-like n=1 Tax=Athalia rosae TaxID=37344 RepID=UPI0020343900|nr:venom acid phosphatase Acph-1-like [Athalia rosae]